MYMYNNDVMLAKDAKHIFNHNYEFLSLLISFITINLCFNNQSQSRTSCSNTQCFAIINNTYLLVVDESKL